MIPVHIEDNNIIIRNIESNELSQVINCINETKSNFIKLGMISQINYEEITQRYLESLMNSLEYFCGIFMNEALIGIIKGRIENKFDKELYILSFLLLQKYRGNGFGSNLLKVFEKYFAINFSIYKFNILVNINNKAGENFWLKNGYSFSRNIQAFPEDSYSQMIIYDKNLYIQK